MEYRAVVFIFTAQSHRVDQISVVCQHEIPITVTDDQRLDVARIVSACRRVAHMTYRYPALTELVKCLPVKRIANQSQRLVILYLAAVAHSNAAAFLPAMLQGKQTEVNAVRRSRALWLKNAENAAFLVDISKHQKHRPIILMTEPLK